VKQKNMILVAVAVGCGLVAAVLTSQMSAGSKKTDGVLLPVAMKDIPVGTPLIGTRIEEFVEYKEFPKEMVPAAYVGNSDDLKDKRLTRNLRKGEAFNPADVTKSVALTPPEGFDMMAIECTLVEGVAGFVQPGARVNVIAAIPSKRNQGTATVVPFLLDMLVLAVDNQSQIVEGASTVPTISSVSMAVTPEHALLLSGAKQRNCAMRLVLRNPVKATVQDKIFTNKELWSLLADQPLEEKTTEEAPKVKEDDKVKLAVAREDLPAGIQLTKEVIDEKFEMVEFTKPAPAQGIENIRDYTGKYLTNPLAARQYVPKSFLGDDPTPKKPKKAAPEGELETPKESPKTPEAPVLPKKVEVPPVYHDVTIQTPNGIKKIRYQVMPNGTYKYLGEVPLVEANKPETAEPKAEKTEEGEKI